MDGPAELLSIEKTNVAQRSDEFAFAAGPVNGQFDVFVRQSAEIAVRFVGSAPEEQADQAPGAVTAEPADQLLGLRVRGQAH